MCNELQRVAFCIWHIIDMAMAAAYREATLFCDCFPQGGLREISMDTSKRTKELPMTVPEARSMG